MIIEKYEDIGDDRFDFGIFGLGYETRSIECFNKLKDCCVQKIAFGYDYWKNDFDYLNNKEVFENNNCEIFEVREKEIRDDLDHMFPKILIEKICKILVDVSVMTRHRLSELLWLLFDRMVTGSEIVVVYSIAEFVEPPKHNYPVKFFGSIIDNFQPMTGRLNLHPVVIVGLGYEKDKALGVVGHLDPENVIFLIPINESNSNYKKD